MELSLAVCKNCLTELSLATIPAKFSLKEFFETRRSQIQNLPRFNEKTAPLNDYPSNWDEISLLCRTQANWICEDCAVSFAEHKEMLHVHHIDGVKYNNGRRNLKVLCVQCHSDLPGHEHIKASLDYRRLLNSMANSHEAVARVAEVASEKAW
jgi:hypothetical protein